MTVLPVAHVSTNAPLAQSLRATSTASTPTSAPSAAPALTLAPLAQSASNFQTQKNPKRLVPHRTGRLLFPAAPSPRVRPSIAAPPTKHRRPSDNASPLLSHPCRTSQTMHRRRPDNASPRLSHPCRTNQATHRMSIPLRRKRPPSCIIPLLNAKGVQGGRDTHRGTGIVGDILIFARKTIEIC